MTKTKTSAPSPVRAFLMTSTALMGSLAGFTPAPVSTGFAHYLKRWADVIESNVGGMMQ